MKSFFIGIPTINRADLLNDALQKYAKDFPSVHIIVLDNGNQNIYVGADNIRVFNLGSNQGVAKSWNWLINKGFNIGYANALILNDDIYLGKTEDQVEEYINRHPNHGFFVGKGVNWSSFILRKSTFEKVGGFDENFFPAYFEDNDYCYRMLRAGITRDQDYFLNPQIYRNSMTIAKEPKLNLGFEKNKAYFVQKWGGLPSQEKFKTPFNK